MTRIAMPTTEMRAQKTAAWNMAAKHCCISGCRGSVAGASKRQGQAGSLEGIGLPVARDCCISTQAPTTCCAPT
jgi:hypothetical protein